MNMPENSAYSIYNLFGISIMFYLFKVTLEGSSGAGGYMLQRYFAARSDRDAGLLSLFWTILLAFRWPLIASFAMLGDIHYAESGCLIAFAGKRVIQATVKEELSPDFQTAEFVEKHGFVDKVVKRKDITNEVGKLLEILLKKNSEVNSEDLNETSENIKTLTKAAS